MGQTRSSALRMRRYLSALIGFCVIGGGCAALPTPPPDVMDMNGQVLMGRSQEQLQRCAEAPSRTMAYPTSTLLAYYREAAIFEESFVGGKGSKAGYHHGCWATLLLEDGRVTGVEFRPVPDPDADTHECQEIFAACVP